MAFDQPDDWGAVSLYKGSERQTRQAGHNPVITTDSWACFFACECEEFGPYSFSHGDVDLLQQLHWMHRTGQHNALYDWLDQMLA